MQKRAKEHKAANGHGANASKLWSKGKRAVEGTYEWVAGSAGRVAPDRKSLERLLEDQPYVIGAIGLGIGAVIGMMLPGFRAE